MVKRLYAVLFAAALLSLTAYGYLGTKEEVAEPDVVCFVLDCSVSMAGEPFSEAKDELWDRLGTLSAGQKAALVVVGREVSLVCPPTERYETLFDAASTEPLGGSHALSEGIALAERVIKEVGGGEIIALSDEATGASDEEAKMKGGGGNRKYLLYAAAWYALTGSMLLVFSQKKRKEKQRAIPLLNPGYMKREQVKKLL